MRRRRRFRMILLLPPVILAAVFVWLAAVQMKNLRTAKTVFARLSQSDADTGPLKAETGTIIINSEKGSGELSGSEVLDTAADSGTVTLLFGGDIYLSSHVLNAYDSAGGIGGVIDEEYRAAISRSDIFMANEEFPFSDRGAAASDKEYTFRLPTARVPVMKEIGMDIVSLANNHAMDYGAEALLDTIDTLDNAGIVHVGAGAGLDEAKALKLMQVKGKKIGFLAASRVIPVSSWAAGKNHPGMLTTYDPQVLVEEIGKARAVCDYLVVYVHWGIEKNERPEEYQRTLGKQYIDAGADIVVGSHPHVLQGIEYYKGKPIVYSLGNFVFGSTIPKTALLKVELPAEGDMVPKLHLLPGTSAKGYTRVLEQEKRPEFYRYIEALSFGTLIDDTGMVVNAEAAGGAAASVE